MKQIENLSPLMGHEFIILLVLTAVWFIGVFYIPNIKKEKNFIISYFIYAIAGLALLMYYFGLIIN